MARQRCYLCGTAIAGAVNDDISFCMECVEALLSSVLGKRVDD
jgi:hypothetical protein